MHSPACPPARAPAPVGFTLADDSSSTGGASEFEAVRPARRQLRLTAEQLIPHRQNRRRGAAPGRDVPAPAEYVSVQINVGTITHRLLQLKLYAAERSAAILTLQEVVGSGSRRETGTYIPGYIVYDSTHTRGAAGSRGAAVCVRKDLTSWSYGTPTDTTVAAAVRTTNGVDLWVSVYLCRVS